MLEFEVWGRNIKVSYTLSQQQLPSIRAAAAKKLLKKIMLTTTPAWQQLYLEQQRLANVKLIDLFQQDCQRAEKYSLTVANIFLDYSKNHVDDSILKHLLSLATAAKLSAKITDLFTGKAVNQTEKRPALHTALRQVTDQPVFVDGVDIIPQIRATQQEIRRISTQLHQRAWLGATGIPITDVVNLGIGGSDLGAVLVTQTLATQAVKSPRVHFISNIDAAPLVALLTTLNPASTLFIIASKSFVTSETLTNANTVKKWLCDHFQTHTVQQHFIAITAQPQLAQAYGIAAANILPFCDWVGGRYSLWSAIGLPIAIAIGMDNFNQLLQGANAMDEHFRTAPLAENMPVIMALLGIWYINFFHAHTQAIIPYAEALRSLPYYLQQLTMESNGKSVTNTGAVVNYHTAPIVWGAVGTNSQHACHQLLHQGTELVPVDFIIAAQAEHSLASHHAILLANCLAQAQALMIGNTATDYRAVGGNKPSNVLFLEALTPFTIGALIALYEHKVFVQSAIWDIDCFDQWGVELGKQLSKKILDAMDTANLAGLDASTAQLLKKYFHAKHVYLLA